MSQKYSLVLGFIRKDLTFVTRQVGVTTLGLVGETTIGPNVPTNIHKTIMVSFSHSSVG
jgi:hypothetical protein